MDAELSDAIKLLKLLISECPKGIESTEHEWRKCEKCLLINQIDLGFLPYPTKLIRRAIKELEK